MDDRDEKLNAMLEALKAVESSGGTNLNHPGVGPNKAVGLYGIKPRTVDETLNRNPNNPYQNLKGLDSSQLQNAFNQSARIPASIRQTQEPAENVVAKDLANYILNKQHDVPAALGSWHKGQNIPSDKMHDMLQSDPETEDYVKKAMPVYLDERLKNPSQFEKINKFLDPVLPQKEDDEDEDEKD